MELKIHERFTEQGVRSNPKTKFVVGEKEGQKLLTISPPDPLHILLLPHDQAPVGAGTIDRSNGQLNVEWGSNSFIDGFGHDRPRDSKEADEVITEVRESFSTWLK